MQFSTCIPLHNKQNTIQLLNIQYNKSSVVCFRVSPFPSLELTLAAFGLGVGLAAAAATSVIFAWVDVRCFIRFELLEADVDKVFFHGHSVHDTNTFLPLISMSEK